MVLPLDALPIDRPVRLEHGRTGLVVLRTSAGVAAFDDCCPHAMYRLSDGEVIDGELECPGHGWRFDAMSGRCSTVPAYCVRTYPTRIADGRVCIWLDDDVAEASERPETVLRVGASF